MTSKRRHRDHRTDRQGFTLIECLIGLAITAMLLTAVAAAFNASVINYCENEETYWSVNNARQALARMTSEIRTAGYLDETTSTWYGVAHNATPSNQCRLYKPNGELITYEFRSVDQKLYLVKNATNQTYALCDGVTAATFTTTSDNGLDATSVQISLTVQKGKTERTLAAAAVVRRNLGT